MRQKFIYDILLYFRKKVLKLKLLLFSFFIEDKILIEHPHIIQPLEIIEINSVLNHFHSEMELIKGSKIAGQINFMSVED